MMGQRIYKLLLSLRLVPLMTQGPGVAGLLWGVPHAPAVSFARLDQAERSLLPIRGNGLVEKTTSTGTSKCSAILSAR